MHATRERRDAHEEMPGGDDRSGVPQVDAQAAAPDSTHRAPHPRPRGQASDRFAERKRGREPTATDHEVQHVAVVDDVVLRIRRERDRDCKRHCGQGCERGTAARDSCGARVPKAEHQEHRIERHVAGTPQQVGQPCVVPGDVAVRELERERDRHQTTHERAWRPAGQRIQRGRQQQQPEQTPDVPERLGEPAALPHRAAGIVQRHDPPDEAAPGQCRFRRVLEVTSRRHHEPGNQTEEPERDEQPAKTIGHYDPRRPPSERTGEQMPAHEKHRRNRGDHPGDRGPAVRMPGDHPNHGDRAYRVEEQIATGLVGG